MFPGASCATVAILSLLLTVPVVTAEKCNTTCDSLTGWRDGFCDDENNNCGCDWDGGDCCRAHSNKKFCSDCLCLEPKDCHKWLCNPTDVTIKTISKTVCSVGEVCALYLTVTHLSIDNFELKARAFDINYLMVNVSLPDRRVQFLHYNAQSASLVTSEPATARTLQYRLERDSRAWSTGIVVYFKITDLVIYAQDVCTATGTRDEGLTEGWECHFPFYFNGRKFEREKGCPTLEEGFGVKGDNKLTRWCATKGEQDSVSVDNAWGLCECFYANVMREKQRHLSVGFVVTHRVYEPPVRGSVRTTTTTTTTTTSTSTSTSSSTTTTTTSTSTTTTTTSTSTSTTTTSTTTTSTSTSSTTTSTSSTSTTTTGPVCRFPFSCTGRQSCDYYAALGFPCGDLERPPYNCKCEGCACATTTVATTTTATTITTTTTTATATTETPSTTSAATNTQRNNTNNTNTTIFITTKKPTAITTITTITETSTTPITTTLRTAATTTTTQSTTLDRAYSHTNMSGNATNNATTTTTTTTTRPQLDVKLDILPHPGVTELHPPSVSMWGDDLLTLEGWGFRPDAMTIFIGGKECKSTNDNDARNETHFRCVTPPHPVGYYEIVFMLRGALGKTVQYSHASLAQMQTRFFKRFTRSIRGYRWPKLKYMSKCPSGFEPRPDLLHIARPLDTTFWAPAPSPKIVVDGVNLLTTRETTATTTTTTMPTKNFTGVVYPSFGNAFCRRCRPGWYSPLGLTCKRCPNNTFCVTNHARAFGFAAAASESLPYLITASALHSATALPPSRGYFPVDPQQKLVLDVSGGAVMPSVHPGFYAAHLDKYGRWTNKLTQTSRWMAFPCVWPGLGCTGGSVFSPRELFSPAAFHIFYPNEDQFPNATLATLAEEISQCGVGHIAGSWLCHWCEERHARWRGRCERCLGPPLLRFLLFLLSLIVVPLGLTLARCRLLLGDEMCSRRRIQEAMAKQRALAMQSLQSLRRAASHATTNVKRATMNAASFGKGLLQQAGGDILLDVTSGAGGRCCPVPSKQCWRACGEKTKEWLKARMLSIIAFFCGLKVYKKARKWPCWTPTKPKPVVLQQTNYRDAVNTWAEGQSTATTNPHYPERWLEGWVYVKPTGHASVGGGRVKPKRRYMVLSEACDLREQFMDSKLSQKEQAAKQRHRKKKMPVSETPLRLRLYLNPEDCNPPLPTIARAQALAIKGRKAHNKRVTTEAREREFQEIVSRHAQIDALLLCDFVVQHQTVLFEPHPPGTKKAAKPIKNDPGGDDEKDPELVDSGGGGDGGGGADIEDGGEDEHGPLLDQKEQREGKEQKENTSTTKTPDPKKKSIWDIFKKKGNKQKKSTRLVPVSAPVMQMPLEHLELLVDFDLEENQRRTRNRTKMKIKCLTQADYVMWSAVLASACQLARDAAEQRAQREAKEAVLLRQKMEEHRRRIEQRRLRKERIAMLRRTNKSVDEADLETEEDSDDVLSAAQIVQLRSAFAMFDKDGSGNIDRDELRAVMIECGVVPGNEEELAQLVDAADTDGDGQISFSEFTAIVRDSLTSAANAPPEEQGEYEDGDGLKPLSPLTPADKTRMMLSVAKQLLILLQVFFALGQVPLLWWPPMTHVLLSLVVAPVDWLGYLVQGGIMQCLWPLSTYFEEAVAIIAGPLFAVVVLQLVGLSSKICGCLDSCSTSTSVVVADEYNVFKDEGANFLKPRDEAPLGAVKQRKPKPLTGPTSRSPKASARTRRTISWSDVGPETEGNNSDAKSGDKSQTKSKKKSKKNSKKNSEDERDDDSDKPPKPRVTWVGRACMWIMLLGSIPALRVAIGVFVCRPFDLQERPQVPASASALGERYAADNIMTFGFRSMSQPKDDPTLYNEDEEPPTMERRQEPLLLLAKDPRLMCGTEEHQLVQIVGALTLFMYGVAWPMLMVVVVLLHRCTELPKNAREEDEVAMVIFLDYRRPHQVVAEAGQHVRKLVLCAILTNQVFGDWSAMPAMLLLGTCVMCFAGHLYSMPMQDEAINFAVAFGHVCLCVLAFVGCLGLYLPLFESPYRPAYPGSLAPDEVLPQTYSATLTWILDVVLVAVRISSGLGDFIAYTRTTARAFAFDSRYVVLVQVSCVVAPVLCLVIAIPVQRSVCWRRLVWVCGRLRAQASGELPPNATDFDRKRHARMMREAQEAHGIALDTSGQLIDAMMECDRKLENKKQRRRRILCETNRLAFEKARVLGITNATLRERVARVEESLSLLQPQSMTLGRLISRLETDVGEAQRRHKSLLREKTRLERTMKQ